MKMSARDFMQYYNGTYVRRKEDNAVYQVVDMNGEEATLSVAGGGDSIRLPYKHVLTSFDCYRFPLGWGWCDDVDYPVYMSTAAGRDYKKGHVDKLITWSRPKVGGVDNAALSKDVIEFKRYCESLYDAGWEELLAEFSDDELTIDYGEVGTAHLYGFMLDLSVAYLNRPTDTTIAGVANSSADTIGARLHQRYMRRRQRDKAPSDVLTTEAVQLDSRQRASLMSSVCVTYKLSDAINECSNHDEVTRLCWRIDDILTVVLSENSPRNGACLYAGPTLIGNIINGEVRLNASAEATFSPYIQRKLEENRA